MYAAVFIFLLFQAKDTVLRRLVYLGIKELSQIAEDVIIVTSSLTKVKDENIDFFEPSFLKGFAQCARGGG